MWIKISAALAILLCLLGLLYGLQRHSLAKAKGKVQEAQETAQRATQELTETRLSFRVDLDAINHAQKAKEALVENASKAKEKVDEVAQKVEKGQLSVAVADAQLLNSMWEIYCKGSDDLTCSSRTTHSGH